jgi:hypothetical protein
LRRLLTLGPLLFLGACASAAALTLAGGAPPGWTPLQAEVRTIGLGLPGGVWMADRVRFAGGVQLSAPRGDRLHGLSDLKAIGEELLTVTDAGDLIRMRPAFDRCGRLAGISALSLRPLTSEDGGPFVTKAGGDAESLAVLPDGVLVVGFEQQPRLWLYGPLTALEARPTPLAVPPVRPGNDGLEAIALAPSHLRVAAESGGVWDCAPSACVEVVAPPQTPLPLDGWRITGMDRDPGGDGWFVVERLYREPIDMRARIRRMDLEGRLGPELVVLSLPSTTDNFEGIAAVAGPDGRTRLYIVSDDNDNPRQRTLLLAFDVIER